MKIAIIFLAMISLLAVSCSDNSGTTNNGSTGKIKGIVLDKDGKFIPGATINTAPATSSVQTDNYGEFQIYNVVAGDYIVTAVKDGFEPGSANVKVSGGYPTNVTIIIGIQSQSNQPPVKPFNPNPVINATFNAKDVNFSWECSDPDNDMISYDFFFGNNSSSLSKKTQGLTNKTYQITGLANGTYFWKVVAIDSKGAVTEGDIWSFTINTNNGIDYTDLVEYLKLDGNAFATVGYDGTNYGVTWTSDRFGNPNRAAYFGSGNEFIEVVKPDVFNLKYDMTLAMWIKPDLASCNPFETHIDLLNFVGLTQGNNYVWYGFGITVSLGLEYWTTGSTFIGIDNDILKDKTWNHVAVVYKRSIADGQYGIASLYINGNLIGSPVSIPPGQSTPDRIWIGQRPYNYASYGGAIDDIYLFKRALSGSELKELAK